MTLMLRMRLRSWANTTNTNRTWKNTVGTVKKSTDTSVSTWFCRKVRHVPGFQDLQVETGRLFTHNQPVESLQCRSLALVEFSDFAPPWVRGKVSEKRHFSQVALVHIGDQRKRCSL